MQDKPNHIDPSNTNYWIFQYNPSLLDLRSVLRLELTTHFPIKAHLDKIKTGDQVILWQSGKKAACYGLATVVDILDKQTLFGDHSGGKWFDWPKFATLQIDYNLWKSPIEKDMLPADHQSNRVFSGLPGSTFQADAESYSLVLNLAQQIDLTEETDIDYEWPQVPDYPLNLVLYGPPGTGKTYHTINYALAAIEKCNLEELAAEPRHQLRHRFLAYQKSGQVAQVTFHASMAYEDFVEGIKPNVKQNQLTYDITDGIFKQICKRAEQHQQEGLRFVLIIDELNRGNIANIFGELITLIESDKRLGELEASQSILPYSKQNFSVPNNLYIICTMNTADRSTNLIDAALRRRFAFVKMRPQEILLKRISKHRALYPIDLSLMLQAMNERIQYLLDEDHCIGHAYFMHVRSLEDLKTTFYESVIPQLEEYFFKDMEKLSFILGEDFMQVGLPKKSNNWLHNPSIENNAYFRLKKPEEIDHTTFINIYKGMKSKP